jgi:hypothetical protein
MNSTQLEETEAKLARIGELRQTRDANARNCAQRVLEDDIDMAMRFAEASVKAEAEIQQLVDSFREDRDNS